MISQYIKLTAFNEMAEVFNGEVDAQELAVKGAVPSLCWPEFPREVGNRAPSVPDVLL